MNNYVLLSTDGEIDDNISSNIEFESKIKMSSSINNFDIENNSMNNEQLYEKTEKREIKEVNEINEQKRNEEIKNINSYEIKENKIKDVSINLYFWKLKIPRKYIPSKEAIKLCIAITAFISIISVCSSFLVLGMLESNYGTLSFCDNKHVMCDYYRTEAIISNIKIKNVYVKKTYLHSVNNECSIIEVYDNPFDLKDKMKKEYGTTKEIFVKNDDMTDCMLEYKNYNPHSLKIMYNLNIMIIVVMLFCIIISLLTIIVKSN